MKRLVLAFVLVCLVVGLGGLIYATTHYEICDYYLSTLTIRVPHEVQVGTGMYAYIYDREDTTTVVDSVAIDTLGFYCFDVTSAGEYWIKIETNWYKKYAVQADSVVGGTVYMDTAQVEDLKTADIFLGTTYTTGGRISIYVHNRSSSSMAIGDALTWEATAVEVASYISDAEAVTAMDETLEDSSGYWVVYVLTKGTADGDTVTIFGTTLADGADHSATDTCGTTANDVRAWPGLWSQVDSFETLSEGTLALDSIRISAHPYMSVADASAKELEFAGIVYPTAIASDDFGWIVIWGICKATVDGAETDCIYPGDLLTVGGVKLDDADSGIDSLVVAFALGMTCDLDDTITVFITGH